MDTLTLINVYKQCEKRIHLFTCGCLVNDHSKLCLFVNIYSYLACHFNLQLKICLRDGYFYMFLSQSIIVIEDWMLVSYSTKDSQTQRLCI